MQNYNKQQQGIILKGIAQNLLQMSVPDINQLNQMLEEFGFTITTNSKIDALSPEKWLLTNYGIKVGDTLKTTIVRIGWIVDDIAKADNIGHFRTDYPVVLKIHNDSGKIDKVTIETLFGS